LGIDTNGSLTIVKVFPYSPAHRAGLHAGLILTHVNRQPVTSSAMVKQAMLEAFSDAVQSNKTTVSLSLTVQLR
jgi:S1-C subfamily serine protease